MSSTLSSSTQIIPRYFVGFSTQNSARTGVSTFYDIDLVNIDLMTSFMTRVGERVMRPDWGCKLWDYLMEPFTTMLQQQIISETQRICNLDTRTQFINMQIYQLDHGFRIDVLLNYVPWNVTSNFSVNFENNELVYFSGAPTANTLIG